MDKISAMMDGELDKHQAQAQIVRVKQDEKLLQCWDTFHLIGDAMRGERILSQGFHHSIAARLADEPTVLAPQRSRAKRFAAYALSAAASVSAVALVGWVAFFSHPFGPQSELAKAPSSTPHAVTPVPQLASVPSDGKMNEYLIAHQEFSPSTALQGLAPYIRSVSSTQGVKGQ